MGTITNPNAKHHVFVVEGYVAYEESCIIGVAMSVAGAEQLIKQHVAKYPKHLFDSIGVNKVEFMMPDDNNPA